VQQGEIACLRDLLDRDLEVRLRCGERRQFLAQVGDPDLRLPCRIQDRRVRLVEAEYRPQVAAVHSLLKMRPPLFGAPRFHDHVSTCALLPSLADDATSNWNDH
jgi:hypothetical protein